MADAFDDQSALEISNSLQTLFKSKPGLTSPAELHSAPDRVFDLEGLDL